MTSKVRADVPPFRFQTNAPACGPHLASDVPVDVWWHPVRGDQAPQRLEATGALATAFLRDAAHRNDVFVVLRFEGLNHADEAAKLFGVVVESVGLGESRLDPFGAGIATTGDDGFVQGVFRDADGNMVAGQENAARVRALDLLLAPATPEQRLALLGAVQPR